MHELAQERSRQGVDRWLRNVVARAMSQSDTITTDRAELWALLDSLPAAVLISTDRACTRIVGNQAAQAMFRVPHGTNMSQSAPANELPPFQVYDEGRLVSAAELPMQKAAALGERVSESECEIRFNDGQSIYIAGHSIPIFSNDNQVCGSIGAFVDVTWRKEQLEIANLISNEMAHRAKNEASMILAIAKMTMARKVEKEAFDAFEKRLLTIARLNAAGHSDDWKLTRLWRIIDDSVIAIVGSESKRVLIDGPSVDLEFATGRNLGMMLHELATNACKYGALSNDTGELAIGWTISDASNSSRVDLKWTETRGPPIETPKNSGFGTKLIRTLIRGTPEGSCQIEYNPGGLQAHISFLTSRI